MAGIIKNQILKHLSRFVKNLSSDKISLSTLKGEGELNNLELEEEVLTELLALPTWMKLTHAHCNRVLIRIQWTKLKSVPIHLSLDEVHIRVQACEELRQGTPTTEAPSIPTSLGKYGFVNKVIDGITATVNSVEITFHSQAFESKVQISRIRVESKSPEWHRVELSGTRLKDMQKGETLIFKEMEWQTLRLEARSTTELHLAPLRLLANQAKARIVMKKKLSDSQVVGCRLSLILDDLLWVLTDSQILAALHFINSLSGLIKQATELTQKVKAARKLEGLPEYLAQLSQASEILKEPRTDAALRKFDAFDVKETSYHFICEKIDLHFCDDPGSGRSLHPDLKEGGALQLSLTQVMLDFYPYHLARGTRRFWPKYSDNILAQWLHQAIQSFRISLIDTLSFESLHPPLARTQHQGLGPQVLPESNQLRDCITEQLAKLMTTCLILKVQDLRLFRVTTASKRESPQPFVSTFIERPKDLPVIHCEFTWFYYPGEVCFPLPSSKIYAHIHPIQIHLDTCTILWLNAFISNLKHSMAIESPPSEPDYVDIRLELIMPKVIFENKTAYMGQKERPQAVHFQVSRMVLSNYRSADTGTLHQLTQCLELLQRGDLVYGSDFPSAQNDASLVSEKFIKHAEGQDKLRSSKKIKCTSFQELASELTKDMMWTDPRDVWYIFADPFWADFRIETKKRRTSTEEKPPARRSISRKSTIESNTKSIVYPFVDAVPLTVWLHPCKIKKGEHEEEHIQALFSTNGICKVQLNHYQYLFVMRMAEALGELSLFITLDAIQIVGKSVLDNLVTFLGCGSLIEVSLLFPQPLPEKSDTPSLEIDSTIPESSSADADLDQQGPVSLDGHGKIKSFSQTSALPVSLSTSALVSAPVSLSCSPNLHGSNPALESINSNIRQNMKHGLSSLAVSFNKGGISTPDSEIASNWSNFSSSSSENNFVTLDVVDPESVSLQNTQAVSNHGGEVLEDDDDGVEVATEVVEENDLAGLSTTPSPTPMFPDDGIPKHESDDIVVGLLTAKLEGFEIAQEGRGLDSIIKIQCKSVGINECTSIPWNEFQKKFAARCRTWPEETQVLGSPTQKRALKLRLSQNIEDGTFWKELNSDEAVSKIKSIKTPTNPRINLTDRPGESSPIRSCITDSTKVFLDARIDLRNEGKFVLHMTTAMGLADFVEDEIIPTPFPLQLELLGINVEMIEDRPSANVTSPGPVPILVSISNPLPIARDKHGVFHIGERSAQTLLSENKANIVPETNHASTSSKSDSDLLQEDLEKALKRLDLAQKKNATQESELASIPELKMMIVQLQEEVIKLQEEKSTHLSLLRNFQTQNNKI